MSNVISPPAFTQFPAPYRIQIVYNRLKAALSHRSDVTVSMEPLKVEDDARLFPNEQHDTCRVWARRGELDLNIHGVIIQDVYSYRMAVYNDGSPKGLTEGPMSGLDEIIATAVAVFQ